MMKKKWLAGLLAVVLIVGIAGCTGTQTSSSTQTADSSTGNSTGKVTDYSKDENWGIRYASSSADYDLVFVYGTAVNKATDENGVGDICDEMRDTANTNYIKCGSQLAKVKSSKGNSYSANVYMPLYRQIALEKDLYYDKHQTLIDNDRAYGPADDMKAALDYYFTNYNPNAERPFVLAGHSQGSAMIQVLIEDYFINGGHKDYLKNMIAAYSTGYGVSKKWFNGLDKQLDGEDVIHIATGATDTNCVLCWNTEGEGADKDATAIILCEEPYDTYAINPINWKTDETQASRSENLGVLVESSDENVVDPYYTGYKVSTNDADKFNARLNLERGSVVCSEHSGVYTSFPGTVNFWVGTNMHPYDGVAFYMNMNVNLGDRIDAFLSK